MPTTIDLDLVDDGDAFTAASLNSRFTALKNGINDLPEYAIEDHGLGPNHLPSLVIDINPTPDLTRRFDVTPAYTQTPASKYDDAGGTWGNNDSNWEVVSDGSGGSTINSGDLVITHDEIKLGMTETARIGAVLVFYNLCLVLPSGSNFKFYFAIQYKNSAGTWKTIRSTEQLTNPVRMLNTVSGTSATLDLPFHTILRSTEIPVAFKGLRVACCSTTGATSFKINKASFTIIPLHCAVS